MSENATILQLHRGDVYPPSNGEEVRVWETAKKLTDYGQVWLAHPGGDGSELRPGIRAEGIDNPFLEYKTTCIYGWNALFALTADNSVDRLQSRQTVRSLKRPGVEFDVVCCESPQMLRAGRRLAEYYDAKLLLNKHNAMYRLLDQQLRLRPIPRTVRRRAVENLRRFEQRGIEAADAVVFQSEDDVTEFRLPRDVLVEVIPNGTGLATGDADADPDRIRERFSIPSDATVCLFVGAFDYDPNEIAAEIILEELAPALPGVEFLVVGRNPPDATVENVRAPGYVEDLPAILSAADVAICPLTMGSGTKLKMLDYLAAGLPIVTTDVGTQGLPLNDGETVLVRNSWNEFAEAIDRLRTSESLRATLSAEAQSLGREYKWDSLLDGYDPLMDELLDSTEREASASAVDGRRWTPTE